jgi:hypothetical protein
MRETTRRWGLVGVALAVAFWLVAAVGNTPADDKKKDDDKEDKELRDNITKLADAIKGDKKADFAKLVKMIEKADLDDIMGVQSLRDKNGTGGLGIGAKPGKIRPDGIEAQLRDRLAEKALTAKQLKDESEALIKACYIMAAVAKVAHGKCPVDKKCGCKNPADWKKWSEAMEKDAIALAKELEKKDASGAKVKTAATKLYGNCTSCHAVFKN